MQIILLICIINPVHHNKLIFAAKEYSKRNAKANIVKYYDTLEEYLIGDRYCEITHLFGR